MADPVVHITAGIPDSGTGNITTLGQTLLDGANLTLGATTDAAATGAGTVNAHLRALAGTVSAGALTVSGTFSLPTGASTSANQPTNAGLGSTTSGQTGTLSLGAVTTSSPTYVNGQTNALSLDTTGSLRVALTSSFAGGVGTSASDKSAFTAGSTAFTPSGGFFQTTATTNPLTPGQMGAWQLTATRAGFVNLRDATGTEIGTPTTPIRSAPDSTIWAMTGTSANVNVSNTSIGVTQSTSPWVVSNGGTFAVQLTGATNNINNISGTISLPTGAATSANQPSNAAAASTTTGQTGNLAMGAVTTAAPAYTTATTNNLSLTTAGALRVDGSAVTQPVSGTFWQTTQPVSGTVTATQGGTWNITNVSGTVSLPTGASTSANQPSNAGIGSTTSGQTGTLAMGAVTTGNPTYTTAQTSPLSLDTSGALRVNVIAGSGGGGTSSSFGSAFPATGTAAGAEYLSTPPTLTNGQMVAFQTNVSGSLKVDGSAVTQPVSGTFWQATQPVSGTVTANQGGTWTVQPGNTANTTAWLVTGTGGTFPATQSGNWTSRIVGNGGAVIDGVIGNATAPANMIAVGGVFNTTRPTLTTGQSAAFQSNSNGVQLVDGSTVTQPVSIAAAVTVQQATAANLNATVTGTVTANQGGAPWSVNGDTASGVADANNPIKIGGVARTSNPTAVTNGQRVNGIFDKLGKQVVVGALRDVKGVQKTPLSVTTETTVVTAGGAGVFNDVYAIIITNTSATGVSVDFRDATAGTIRMTLYAPATDTRGFTVPVDSAMVQAVAANNWTATASGAVSSLQITVLYVSNL
jgi:hypothetical protein